MCIRDRIKLEHDTTQNIHFRNLIVPFLEYVRDKHPEVVANLGLGQFAILKDVEYDNESAKKYLKYLETDILPKMQTSVSAYPYNMCTIRHDKISKDLKVDKFCTSRSEQAVHPDFMSALQKRKAPTLVSFRDNNHCLLYTSPSPRDATLSRMPSSA